ncbi:MAG: response regulator transcription factor [Cyanobacteria bacterium]|nr:response regulator transcription factor [Cyanobacteriota bacterium]
MKLLVVEDDAQLRGALIQLLGRWGYACEGSGDGASALALLEVQPFDLVLLDLGLPGVDGLEVCKRLRQLPGHQPLVLMLTARDASGDKVRGLDSGADDYLVKPFEPAVLQAQVRALLRRRGRPLDVDLSWGPLRLIPGQSVLWIEGQPLAITRKEALLLEMLLRRQGQCSSKQELLSGSSASCREVGEATIKAHIRNLRSKLTNAGCRADLIETVYGLGYRLNPSALA